MHMNDKFKIAIVATIYFSNSHADVIGSRWMQPRAQDAEWGWPQPRSRIVSAYIDQIGEDDMGQEICKRHGVPIHDTVAGALGCGRDGLAVDGVLLIGEHGKYGRNEIGQDLYPRKELFDRIVEVYRSSGRTAPMFCDKHLSWNFDWAREMHDTAEQMGFVLTAGSSIPLCRRHPPLTLPEAARIEEAVVPFFGPDEAYGFHSFEFAQAILERRGGAESGVKSITAWRGDDMFRHLDEGGCSTTLMDAAIAAIAEGSRRQARDPVKAGDYRENCKDRGSDNSAFCLEYVDGMKVTHVNLSGHIDNWGIAMSAKGGAQPLATAPVVGDQESHHGHFATLSRIVEDALMDNRHPFSPKRSLLTTGLTAAAMRARAAPGERLATPELATGYTPGDDVGVFSL
jgi:hypothetical protein